MVVKKIHGMHMCFMHEAIEIEACLECGIKYYWCKRDWEYYHVDNSICRRIRKQHRGIYSIGRERVVI